MYFGSVMPPRTRTRVTKNLKENIDIVKKTKAKSDGKITKPPRKALADKTNSLSDDNASIDAPIKTTKVASKNGKLKSVCKDVRPRRDRKLPTRYLENQVLNNLSNSKENKVANISGTCTSPVKVPVKKTIKPPPKNVEVKVANRPKRNCRVQSSNEPPATNKPGTPSKETNNTSSPFKTPSQSFDSSLETNRPKRICRLPSRFEENSISPKFLSVLPCHASTPIVQKAVKESNLKSDEITKPSQESVTKKVNRNIKIDVKTKSIDHYFTKTQKNKKTDAVKDVSSSSKDKTSPDSNNNPKSKRIAKRVLGIKSSPKKISPKANTKIGFGKRLLEKNLSFRVFEDRKSKDKDDDIYEFTFDPNEEPTPQKKKRKKVVKKRPPKPKTVVLKNNYEKNLKITLESLKNKVKPSQPQIKPQTHTQIPKPQKNTTENPAKKIQVIEDVVIKPPTEINTLNYTPALPVNESAKSIHMSNYASIRVEDIAADFEASDNLNYSPVNSPCRPKTPSVQDNYNTHTDKAINSHIAVNNQDPLNLQGETSFFDEQPVASSSMNISVRHPLASPWRVEFGNLPIRWQANTYVKPNMTPAVESSFINSEDIGKKKHVYTNLLGEEPLPVLEEPPNLKQTSIISFMREVAERSLKKKRGRSISPTKANSLFEDSDTSNFGFKTPKKARKEKVVSTPKDSDEKSREKEESSRTEHSNENYDENQLSNHEESNENDSPVKKTKPKDGTFFGFDESESYDQENVSPVKNVRHTRARGLRAKSRGVLQEINAMNGPTRAVLPKPKLASLKVVEQLYDQMKSAEDAPIPSEKRNPEEAADEPSDDDGQSVHLFEDIEVVHHLKPHRKSYGKAKKVTFRQRSNSDSDTQTQVFDARSSDEDDLSDLTFQMPNVKERKVIKRKKPKKQMSKKEEQEVEKWAAGFNSMCEDIDDFPLVVE